MVLLLVADLAVASAAVFALAVLLGSLTLVGHACLHYGLSSMPSRPPPSAPRAASSDAGGSGALMSFLVKGYGLALVTAQVHAWVGGPLAAYAVALMLELLSHDQSLHSLLEPTPDPLDCGFVLVLLPCLCAPAMALHGFGAAWFLFLHLAFVWRTAAADGLLEVLGGVATLALAYALAWAVGLFSFDVLVDFGLADCALVVCGAAFLVACPRGVALGLLPVALARSPIALRTARATLELAGHAVQHASATAWRVLPMPSDWLRWAASAATVTFALASRLLLMGFGVAQQLFELLRGAAPTVAKLGASAVQGLGGALRTAAVSFYVSVTG